MLSPSVERRLSAEKTAVDYMQLKGVFLSAATMLSAFGAFAQKSAQPVTLQAPSRIIKTDTFVRQSRQIAGVMNPVAPFTGVPLAGHKAYYGAMTDFVNGYCKQYLGAHTKTLSTVQGRGNNRFSLIDNVLKRHEIPAELKYLAVIESALNNQAVSPVGAVGPWQLMESTARMMGLTVNGKHDDRTDWFKSTNAAAKYLSFLYKNLNDWLLVVAAYNSGPVPVQRAIEKTGSHSFWDIKKFLPRETQGHVLAFIATASIFEKMSPFIKQGQLPEDFKFGNEEPSADKKEPPVPKIVFSKEELESMAIVRLSEPMFEELLTMELGIDKKLFKKWNPDYDLFVYNTYPDEFYRLRIPKEKLDAFIEKKEALSKKSKQIFTAENIL
jgi:membrane-bound lytic murein transglycosylase D